MTITPDTLVSDVASRHPATISVFQRHQIDFCCGGKRPLAEACAESGIPYAALADELERASAPADATGRDWTTATLKELIWHIVGTYHAGLRRELPRLQQMAHRVLEVHGAHYPTMLNGVVLEVESLKQELDLHMMREEEVLFPHIIRLEEVRGGGVDTDAEPGAWLEPPIAVMLQDHEQAAAHLERLRSLTGGYRTPEGACETFQGLFYGLERLDADLKVHVHLENNVLFPRVLGRAASVRA